MISRKDVERLATLHSEEGILSAYIKIDPQLRYEPSQPAVKFKGALKRFARRVKDERWLEAAEREKDRVLSFLEAQEPTGRGLAIFSCEPAGIWEVVHLGVLVPSLVSVDTTTNTALLVQVLDEYPRFVVAVVQRDNASIYIAEQRTADEAAAIESHVPGQHDKGGWAQARFQRHIEFHFERHLKKVVEGLEQVHYDQPFNRLAVGGTEETANELVKMLPEPLSRRVIGTFPVDFKHQTEDGVLEQARELLHEDERRSERRLVEQLVDVAESGGRGVVGIDETVRAVLEGRVHVLVVAEGVIKEGAACQNCDYLAAGEFGRCPVCGEEAETIPDIVERLVEGAYLTGAHVETVFGEAREWLLARGRLGAVLRY
ncbi:MAG: baeRF10 domain-containing protein [Dehalococcoidia bacterium]